VATFAVFGPVVLGWTIRLNVAGSQDQGQGHLPGSGAIQPQPLRQSQWLALVELDAAGTYSMGEAGLGTAFLTVLAPSERYYEKRKRAHKKLTDWARQALLQVRRWLPGRKLSW